MGNHVLKSLYIHTYITKVKPTLSAELIQLRVVILITLQQYYIEPGNIPLLWKRMEIQLVGFSVNMQLCKTLELKHFMMTLFLLRRHLV